VGVAAGVGGSDLAVDDVGRQQGEGMTVPLTVAPGRLADAALARYAGSTPVLVLDLDRIGQAYDELRAALPGAAIHYAMKCNPADRVLGYLADRGCRFEIASAGELDDLIGLGIEPNSVIFSNPVKPWRHVRAAYRAGVRRFALDSRSELDKIAEHAPGSSVYVRISAPVGASEVPSEGKFGVDLAEAEALMTVAVERGLRPYGIAFHVGSQMTDPGAWETAIRASGVLMRRLEAVGIRLAILDIGGGFPVPYAGPPVPPVGEIGAVVMAAMERELPYPVDLVAEPGRYLAAEAGVLVTEVIGTARRAGKEWLHLDVGAFNGMMESLETRNQLILPLGDSLGSAGRQRYHLTGPTCDSQDTLFYDVELSAGLTAGDRVHLYCAGAYTTSYASTFNGFPVPTVRYV
jgi:ornithine decarboxylase